VPARLRRAEQVERNREVVLAAAKRVFLERGYAGASVEAISDEAGFSKGVVYSQFGSKADMFLALLDRRIDERAAENERMVGDLAGTDAARALLLAAARDAADEAGWARLLIEFRASAGRDPELNRRYAEAHARTLDALVAVIGGIHQRAGREPAVPLRSMAEFIVGVGSAVALERLANPGALADGDLAAMVIRALGLPDSGSIVTTERPRAHPLQGTR
jgi:AcrR family transcriptional regulator